MLLLATAVSRVDNLEFLADVIPKTTTYKQFKAKENKNNRAGVQKGQKTLNGKKQSEPRSNKGIEHMLNATTTNGDKPPAKPSGGRQTTLTTMVDRTVEASGRGRVEEEDEDMEE